MKLLYITPYYKPSWHFGGPPRCIAEQAEILHHQLNWQIDVLTLNLNGKEKLFNSFNTVTVKQNGIKVDYLPHFKTPFYNYFFSPQLYNYFNSIKNYDVVHIHGLFNSFSSIGMRMAKKSKVPFVVTPHGMLDRWCLQKSAMVKYLHKQFIDRNLLKSASLLHFTTISEKNNSIFPSNVKPVIIPYLLDFHTNENELHQEGNDKSGKTNKIKMVFWGRINPKKGLLLFIEALNKLTEDEKQRMSLDVYGNDEENHLKKVQQLINRYNLQQTVCYKGFLKPQDRDEVIKQYDIMILTSYQENFGITVLEALQHNIPVFISDKVNLAEWVEKFDCGWVATTEQQDITIILRKLLSLSRGQIKQKGYNGIDLFRQEMNKEKLTQQYRAMYEGVTVGKCQAAETVQNL